MDHTDEHDDSGNGERESRDPNRLKSTSGGSTPQSPKLVPVKGTGLSGPFIRRPVMTVLLTASVIVAGIATYNKLAVNDLPAVDYPIIQVSCSYPGADPVTMANNIATPLEKQFLQIPGLDIITSSSTQSNTSLTLQFVLSKSITDAATDVQAAIQRATGKLPLDLPSPPTFSKTNPNDQAVYLVGFMSDTLTDGDLYKYASTVVAQRMAILPGVSQVNIYGVQGAIRIKADPAALASRGLTMDDLANAIRAGTVYSGAGQFDGPHRTFVLQPNGQIDEAEGYRNLIVARNKDRSPVYLRDIAEVKQSVQDERTSRFFWVRGFARPPGTTVVLAVSRQAGANAVEVANSVKALFPELRASLPGSISFLPVFDRSQTIVNSVHDVRATLMIAFVLVVMVIYVFLGRATDTLIPAVALPLSLLLTFAVIYLLGFSINNLTLMALTLAIGFLVDDAIVFLENVIRRAEHGESILKATYNTAGEISFTILSMTLSLAAVFIPLVLLPGLLGRIFQEFSVTIIVAILASGLVSLTLTPLMCARILGERRAGHTKARMERWTGDFIQRVIGWYGTALDKFLDRAYLTVPILLVCIIGLWFFFTHLPFTLLPVGDSGFARGVFIAQEGSSPEQMHAYQKLVNQKLQEEPSIAQFFTNTGTGSRSALSQGIIFCVFKPREERDPIEQCLLRLQKSINTIPGITAVITPSPVLQINVGATNQTQGQYAYTLSGIVPEDVYKAADEMMAKLHTFKGFSSVRSDFYNSTPNLTVNIDRERAAMYGVSTSAIQSLLKNAYSQNYVYLIKQPDDQYQVILEVKDNERATPGDLNNLYLRSSAGAVTQGGSGGGGITTTTGTASDLVPLRAVTSTKQVVGPQAVNHFDQFTSVTINFNLLPGVAIGDATKFIEDSFAQVHQELPSVQSTFQGEALVFRQLFQALPLLLIGAIFVMYVILGILYESYVHPITVLFPAIVPAVVGGLATLWIFGSTLSLYSVIGLFLLLGIVKKNGIMVVDFALQRIDEGWDLRSAIHEASVERFRPIMMTTLAALMGAIPLALGFGQDASSRRPLGLVIVGGLVFSQMVTLFVTPVIYLWLEWFQEHVLDKVPFLRSAHFHPHDEPSHGDVPEPAAAQ